MSSLEAASVEYTRRLERYRTAAARLDTRHRSIARYRLWAFATAVLIWWKLPTVLLVLPAGAFFALLYWHERVAAERRHALRASSLYEAGLARLEDRWAGRGYGGERFQNPQHPYASDLDLFGAGSLFELLSTTRTPVGEEILARWLLAPASPDQIRARQQAVAELRPAVDLREDLALAGEAVRSSLDAASLAAWGQEPTVPLPRHARATAAAFAIATIASALVIAVSAWFKPVFLVMLLLDALYSWRLWRGTEEIILKIEKPAHDLTLLSAVLQRIEGERFTSPLLASLRQRLETEGLPPSRQIARLNRWVELLDSRDHLLIRVIGPPLLYSTQLALAVEAWRVHCGHAVGEWLAALGEIEALSAISGYAYEHAADPFPEIIEAGGPLFQAEALAHPLLPAGRAVPNDVSLGPDQRLLIVSGSNMSGKSTLLRTIGTNAVLALAGAPVRASALRLAPCAVGASIRTLDSLQGGTSRFYAEITRLRQLVDMTSGPLPLLFLLDELLHGTNSHDRRIGAERIVKGLLERGAIGLLTTHDLALAHIADALAAHAANVHFEDHLENGQIVFDYQMRPGVVTKSNALELMRSLGFDV